MRQLWFSLGLVPVCLIRRLQPPCIRSRGRARMIARGAGLCAPWRVRGGSPIRAAGSVAGVGTAVSETAGPCRGEQIRGSGDGAFWGPALRRVR